MEDDGEVDKSNDITFGIVIIVAISMAMSAMHYNKNFNIIISFQLWHFIMAFW